MKKFIILVLVLVLLGGLGFGGYQLYNYLNQDFTGVPYEQILAYQNENPHVNISYTVTIEGGAAPLELNQDSTEVSLTVSQQVTGLIAQAEYLQQLTTIDLGETPLSSTEMEALEAAFPGAELKYTSVMVLGNAYAPGATDIDLSAMTSDQLDTAIAELQALPYLQSINMLDASGNSQLTLDDMVKFYTAYPDVKFTYATDLFGQRWTTDTELIEYARQNIGDAGLAEIRKMLPMMPENFYLRMDDCKTTDEAMDQLRTDFPTMEIHWRIFYSVFDVMTDNYKLWTIGGLMNKQIVDFPYLRKQKYIDLGHNYFTDLDWMENLTDAETVILAIGKLEDISGIANCKKITFLEIFSNRKLENDDMQHLAGLTEMEYLNISNLPLVTDLSFTDNMTKLKKLWCTLSNVPQAEIDRVKALHPDCEFVFLSYGNPTDYGWRTNDDGSYNARYQLLREQIGYDKDDVSQWPKGELREEITYESTGITPDN